MTAAPQLTPEQVKRYSRHIIMPQIGSRGQRKLMDAKVLVIGAGGLGGPAALYLALAGVGTIGIVDFDVVELSNLQRQVLHNTETVGMPKVLSAAQTLHRYNPEVTVVTHEVAITSENAMELIAGYDLVVNGADNFATRYLVNDATYLSGKPLVDGSIQATEVVKVILGIGEPLVGRLLLIDALTMEFRSVTMQRQPKCPLCGDNPTVTELIDYEVFCGLAPPPGGENGAAAH